MCMCMTHCASIATQVAFADRILLNKTDLVSEAELAPIEERLHKINPTTDHLPLTTYHLPLTTLTAYCLLLTAYY